MDPPERMGRADPGAWLGGVDEAGRGPAIGPLVVAGVATSDPAAVAASGVRDSKQLSPERRERLFGEVLAICEARVLSIGAEELDALMGERSLNEIEFAAFDSVIRALPARKVVVDAFGDEGDLSRRLGARTGREVIARHKADVTDPVVSAASVVAKVLRDRAVKDIARALGADIGSGYPADPVTVAFLQGYVAEHGRLPPHARHRWETSQRLMEHKLDSF